jgi:hypothetical protein
LAGPPADKLDDLRAYELRNSDRTDSGGLTVAVRRAVAENPDWGIELASSLRERDMWETVRWKSVVGGWNQDGLSPAQCSNVLDLLVGTPRAISRALDEVVELLERRISGDSNPFKGALLGLAVKVGVKVWQVLESREHERKPQAKDWLFVAINDTGGRLAQFFLPALWQAHKEAGDAWRGVTGDFRLCLESAIRGTSWAAEMAKVVIAAHLQTLFFLDARWTDENVFGLFDWSANARQAQQAWHGYLTWGKWDNSLLEKILPRCRETFPRIEGDLGDHGDQFCELMAGIALYGSVSPMESGWLQDFIQTAGLNARKKWASAVGEFLRSSPPGKRGEVWARWMKSYWRSRLWAPPSLDAGEVTRMVEWTFELEEAFPEAVRLTLEGPAAESGDLTLRFFRWKESTVWHTYPLESALLLRFLVQSQNGLPPADFIGDLVRVLAPLGAETAVLVDVCQRLAELGDISAGDLERYVQTRGRTPAA